MQIGVGRLRVARAARRERRCGVRSLGQGPGMPKVALVPRLRVRT